MSPVSWRRLTSGGMARERSRSACSQSKREPARSLDGLDAGLGGRVEVGVRLELGGLRLELLLLLRDAVEVGVALLDGVVGQDDARDAGHTGGEHAEDDECASAALGLRAGAELGGRPWTRRACRGEGG